MQFFEIENFAVPAKEIPMNYVPACLRHTSSEGWYMEYSCYNEMIDHLERRRVYLNMYRKRYRTLAEFRTWANGIISATNIKLMGGWTPFGQRENTRNFLPLVEVCDIFLKEKKRELTEASYRSYKNFCDRLCVWVNKNLPNCLVAQFTGAHANSFLDYVYTTPCVKVKEDSENHKRMVKQGKYIAKEAKLMSPNTFNSFLKFGKAFWGWCVSKEYIKESPFEKIKPKMKVEKKREMIPLDVRQQIVEYIRKENPAFEIIYHLVMTALIRPVEITRLQIMDVDIASHCIKIPGTKTKNHHPRVAPLTDAVCELLKKHIEGYPETYYLFNYKYVPTDKPSKRIVFDKWWTKMRQALNLDDSYQLYSLRDTGMNTMMTECGLDPVTVMETADHSDLSITTKYIKHFHGEHVEKVRAVAPAI